MRADDKYNERVEVVLGRSRLAEAFVAIGAVATAALLAALPLPLEVQAGGLAWIAAAAVGALRRLRPGLRLSVDEEGGIGVGGATGTLVAGSFVAPWLTAVRWSPAGAWLDRTLLVMPDMLAAEEHRRLRVLLRAGRNETGRPEGRPADETRRG